MFNEMVKFMQGLTKEEVYGNTAKVTKVEVMDQYKGGLYRSIEEVAAEIDNNFNQGLKRMRLAMEDDVELTHFVKGGRL